MINLSLNRFIQFMEKVEKMFCLKQSKFVQQKEDPILLVNNKPTQLLEKQILILRTVH